MSADINEFPWKNTADAAPCNFAFGHLFHNIRRCVTVNERIHAETYISAIGAIAGYAAQKTLFARTPPVMGANINRVGTKSGDHYWFGDTLNHMLVPVNEAEAGQCIWPLAAGSAVAAGLQVQQLPKLEAMFKHVSATIGGVNEGKSSVTLDHQAQLLPRDLLRLAWPIATLCFSGKFPNQTHEYGSVPVIWWSAIAARAVVRPIQDLKSVLAPATALTILMESAIYGSKLDQLSVEGDKRPL